MLYFLQQVLNGLHGAGIYALLAFGYALVNGVLHRTNLAHGAVFAFSGQVVILVAVFGWKVLWLTLPATLALGVVAALLYAWLLSALLTRAVFRPLARRSPNAIVVATLGVAIALMEAARIGADTRDWWLPPLLAGPLVLVERQGFAVTVSIIQVFDIALALAALVLAAWLLRRSRFGRALRAVSDDPGAASLTGVDVARIFAAAVLCGSLLAAIAGIQLAVFYGNVSFGTGLAFGLKVLFVTAVGGYDRPERAAAGAALFGLVEQLWSGYFPGEWRDAWMFGLLVALLVLTAGRREELSGPRA